MALQFGCLDKPQQSQRSNGYIAIPYQNPNSSHEHYPPEINEENSLCHDVS